MNQQWAAIVMVDAMSFGQRSGKSSGGLDRPDHSALRQRYVIGITLRHVFF
jgi:hypothetical protein